jgi:hypothetical protein
MINHRQFFPSFRISKKIQIQEKYNLEITSMKCHLVTDMSSCMRAVSKETIPTSHM